jgi:PDZ domain-containing secreted protein
MNPTDPPLSDLRPLVDDEPDDAEAGVDAESGDHHQARFWTGKRMAWTSLAAVAVVILAASGFVTVGQVAIAPGGLHETERRIEVDGTTAYPSDGEMLFATVSVREVTFWGWLQGKLDDDIKLLPREQVYGERDPDETRDLNFRLMDTSKIVATALALEREGALPSATGAFVREVAAGGVAEEAGLPQGIVVVAVDETFVESVDQLETLIEDRRGESVTVAFEDFGGNPGTVSMDLPSSGDLGVIFDPMPGPASSGALVAGLLPGFPAAEELAFGEVIVEIDGEEVVTTRDALRLINGHDPGDEMSFTALTVDGELRDGTLVLAERPDDERTPEDESGGPFVGIEVRPAYATPYEVAIDSGKVGGPSAGLAFTLAVIDLLTPGELTGGVEVAATGEVQDDGRIGIVGGVTQKTASVRDRGVELFLVPAGDFETAATAADDSVEVVAVETLDDALAALAERGGNAGDFIIDQEPLSL